MNRARPGFTLIEMLIVMVLIGILFAVAIPFLRKPSSAASVDAAMDAVAGLHAVAKSAAIQRGRTAWLVLKPSSSTAYVVVRRTGSSTAVDTVGKVENLNTRFGVTFTTSDDSLSFSPRGIGMDAGTALMIFTKGTNTDTLSATAITRLTAEGGRSSEAAMIASARFERLRFNLCSSPSSGGNTVTNGYTEVWTITSTSLLRTVTERVSYSTGRGTRSITYVTEISCAPSV